MSFFSKFLPTTQPTTQPMSQPMSQPMQSSLPQLQVKITELKKYIDQFSVSVRSITPPDKKSEVDKALQKVAESVDNVSKAYTGQSTGNTFSSFFKFSGGRRKRRNRTCRSSKNKKYRKTCKR